MGTWSITPKNDKVTINENTGEAHFDRHDYNSGYTITYSDGICGEVSRKIVVYGCKEPEPPQECDCNSLEITYEEECTCAVKDTYEVPAEKTLNQINAARIEYPTKCGNVLHVDYVVEGSDADFLHDFSLNGEYIKAKVNSENESETDTKKAIYEIKIGECGKQITVTQMKKGENPCKCEKLNIELKTE